MILTIFVSKVTPRSVFNATEALQQLAEEMTPFTNENSHQGVHTTRLRPRPHAIQHSARRDQQVDILQTLQQNADQGIPPSFHRDIEHIFQQGVRHGIQQGVQAATSRRYEEESVDSYDDSNDGSIIIRRTRAHLPQPHQSNDFNPEAVTAASTPNRGLTHESLRAMIRDEMASFQNDLDNYRVSRPGTLAGLSRALEGVSLRSEGGLRLFIRHQVAAHAPQISAF